MKKLVLFIYLLGIVAFNAQSQKRELTFDDILKWNRITEKAISNDGSYIVYKTEPWKGDAILKIADVKGNELVSIECGKSAKITYDSKFVIFNIEPKEDTIRELKLKKTKKEDLPLKKLGIFNLEYQTIDTILNLKSVEVPVKWDNYIAFQTKSKIENSDSDTIKLKEESDDNGYKLSIKNLVTGELKSFAFVTDYLISKEKPVVVFVSSGDDKNFKPGIYYYDVIKSELIEIILGKGKYKQLALNESANKLAFLADTMDEKKSKYGLFLWQKDGVVHEIINKNSSVIPEGFEISKNGELKFSEKTERIFFGISTIKIEKDTSILDEEIPKLDVWKWNEPTLHAEQLYTKKNDLKKSYQCVYHTDKKKFIQLEKVLYSEFSLINKGNSDYAIARSNLPYAVQRMWEGYPEHNDFYLIDIKTGKEKLIKKDVRAYPKVSPEGNYIYWYNAIDTSWNTYEIKTAKEFKITNPNTIQCADEINDVPNPADEYGIAGWTKGDKSLLIYDRYDIWEVDPQGKYSSRNITKNGRENKINYRLLDFENANRRKLGDERIGINTDQVLYLKAHNEISRHDAYYSLLLTKDKIPNEIYTGAFKLSSPLKALSKDVFVFTTESFQEFPDLRVSTTNFNINTKISNANPQQKEFLWGTKELYTWTSLDGKQLNGILIKPANFDPNKKYPMIVNFYEKSSQFLYKHQIPEAHRSTVDYHYYSSNGYLIFNPDVYYKTGYPGEDAFNCVMPGITQLISEGFVNKDAIAAQGHSWGGYQVAYLATRTNLFAAIESGAPVVNMFSAYGGIRMWSGRNRSFQYEHTQSRIGKSIWESPLRYLENSPLFTADKIQTPLLIMHNEKDGAVPFGQGVEFFIALRRLGKQAWLLNYNEADHWPTKVRDKYDFQIRLAQFFDHFLKGEPMPKWMKNGIPAVNKGLDMGLELK